jgi:hypothetical protein
MNVKNSNETRGFGLFCLRCLEGLEIKTAGPSKAPSLLRLLPFRLVKMLGDGFNGFGRERDLGVDYRVRVVRGQVVAPTLP